MEALLGDQRQTARRECQERKVEGEVDWGRKTGGGLCTGDDGGFRSGMMWMGGYRGGRGRREQDSVRTEAGERR